MAVMIPNYIDRFTTKGERRFYAFLETFAKPDEFYTSWYLPEIKGKEPDFILYSVETGLVVFEVKDWALEQIEEADPHNFVLRMGKERKRLKSPLIQAREYLNSLMDRLKADGLLLTRDSAHYGHPKVPVDCGVVFPNIDKSEYCRRGLEKVLDPRRAFFKDDLHPESDICRDESGECFRQKITAMFPPRFRFQLSESEYAHLKQLLFPVVRIDQPQRDTCAYVDLSERIHVLDDVQEGIARKCSDGLHVIEGLSGSGKTLILVHKVAFLRAYRPEIKSILFLCRNIALVGYVKRLLSEKGVGLGVGGVEVCHFYEFCSKVLGEEIRCEGEDEDYYALVVDEALSRADSGSLKYDAILVDEGQSFSAKMLQVAAKTLRPGSPNLTIAVEGEIDTDFLFPAFPKVHRDEVSRRYRDTSTINNFIGKFVGSEIVSGLCEITGPEPQIIRLQSMGDIASFVSDTIRDLYSHREYPLSEIAVLYPQSIYDDKLPSLPDLLIGELERAGLIAEWISRDFRAKLYHDITTERISIGDIETAAGLDYACVFLLGLDELEGEPSAMEKTACLGLTRARHRLVIPYVKNTPLIEKLKAAL